MSAARIVYVIMPVGSDPLLADRRTALNKGIRKSGREARFPVYHHERPTFSLLELLEELRNADLIVADLSLQRPSCYYELGVVETLGRPVHVLAESGTPIHQCASRSNVRYYNDLNELTRIVELALNDDK